MKKAWWAVSAIIILGTAGVFWLILSNPGAQQSPDNSKERKTPLLGEKVAIQGRGHIGLGENHPPYNSNPPTSGWHYKRPADWGFYTDPLPDEQVVHNLEHGGIWISYKGVDEQTKQALQEIAKKYNQAVIVSPRPANDAPIALASWGRLLKLESFDEEAIEKFIRANFNHSPEPLASLKKAKLMRGELAPEAYFSLLNGEDTHLSDFKGQKVMFWLLATWCPSCIAGAQVLAQNNDKLGKLTIIALKTYGNAGYPGPSIEEFAKQNAPALFSAPNWRWGDASTQTTKVYNPRNYPDIYFLIDENGVLRAIDGAPAATLNKIIEFAND